MDGTSEIQLLIFPGLGGDSRMAYPQLALPYRIIPVDLIEMRQGESLSEYARRFITQLPIDRSRPLFLAGYSFGSVVAIELSWILNPNGLIIIGGLMRGKELRPVVRWFGRWIAPYLPLVFFRIATPAVRFVMRKKSNLSEHDLSLSIAMYKSFSKQLFRRGYTAISNWRGEPIHLPILRIHGDRDQIISPPNSGPNVLLLRAKHLVNFARPQDVNRAIQNFVDRTMRSES